jgi:hypothetical protein
VKNDTVSQMTSNHHRRAGITLMEVLIAVGILAIGLSSVVALLPAGHSMAQRSFTTDQASIVAANAAADYVTMGFLRPECVTSAVPPLIYDPLGINGGFLTPTLLKPLGLFATAVGGGPRAAPLHAYLARSRDDVVYNVPENPNEDVTNRFSADGIREYQGKFTWAALLTRPATSNIPPNTPFMPGDEAVLSIVVFHQRDPAQVAPQLGPDPNRSPGSPYELTWTPGTQFISGRLNRDVIRTGGVLLLVPDGGGSPAVRRLSLAALNVDKDGKDIGAFVDFEQGIPLIGSFTAYLIPDAVAVLERQVTIEGPNGYVP